MATQLLDTPRGMGGKINRNTNTYVSDTSPTAPPAPSNTTLTSTSLTPTQSFNITPPQQSTAGDGFSAYLSALSTQTAQQKQAATQSKDDYLTTLLKADTETGLQAKAYANTVDPAEAELSDINNQIIASQHAQQREIQALGQNGALTPAQAAAQTNAINRKYTFEQADLAVIQMSKQGKYDSAKKIADRAVTAMLEQQKMRLDALKFNYEENKSLFDKNEQRLFETAQGERERQLQNEEYRLRAEFDAKIKQNDPLYKAQIANLYSEIAKRNAENVQAPLKAQQALQSQVSKAENVINKVNSALTDITKGAFGRTGFSGGIAKFIPGSKAYSLDKTLTTIKANLGFDALQEMRNNSPTGGALGQVAVQELEALQASVASLDLGLPSDQLQSNLNDVRTHYVNWLNTKGYDLAPDGNIVQITN